MKNKTLFVFAKVILVVSNTAYFWQSKFGVYFLLVSAGLVLSYLLLLFFILWLLYKSVKYNIKDKQNIFYLLFLSFVFIDPFIFPGGIIDFEKFESETILIAQREGVANCTNRLKFKVDGSFLERAVCFGIEEIRGNYKLKGDTIFFEYEEELDAELTKCEFAIISKKLSSDDKQILTKYLGKNDTIGIKYTILK